MILDDLPYNDYKTQITGKCGLSIMTGPFAVNIRSQVQSVIDNTYLMYRNNAIAEPNELIDFHVNVDKPGGLRNFISPQIQFYFDGVQPFRPLPFQQAFPMLEWGLNLCVSATANQYLIIHAAVLEKNGAAVILPGPSGSGKSTLCAALTNSDWRLLSDELTLISLKTGQVQPLVRPVSLKNQSIDIIKKKYPSAVFTNVTDDTSKGSVAHMQAPASSIEQSKLPANARLLIFPKYVANSPFNLEQIPRGSAFMALIDNCFNYHLLGERGFTVLSNTIRATHCYTLKYSNLDEAIAQLSQLTEQELA